MRGIGEHARIDRTPFFNEFLENADVLGDAIARTDSRRRGQSARLIALENDALVACRFTFQNRLGHIKQPSNLKRQIVLI